MYNTSTKQKIYETAKRLFYYEGYSVGSRKIAEVAGVNQGLITYYFKNKKNIAMMMLKEHYEIIASYLKYEINPNDDIFLYVMSFINLIYRVSFSSSFYGRFIAEITEENFIEDSVLYFDNQTSIYKKLVKDFMPPNNNSFEKNYRIFSGIVFGTIRNLIPVLYEKIEFSNDELFSIILKIYLVALNLPYNDEIIQNHVHSTNRIVDHLFEQFPDLKNPMIYLFQENKMKN